MAIGMWFCGKCGKKTFTRCCEEKKYRKVIVTKEYIVEAESDAEAKQLYKNFSVWSEQDINTYELTANDLKNYEIN